MLGQMPSKLEFGSFDGGFDASVLRSCRAPPSAAPDPGDDSDSD